MSGNVVPHPQQTVDLREMLEGIAHTLTTVAENAQLSAEAFSTIAAGVMLPAEMAEGYAILWRMQHRGLLSLAARVRELQAATSIVVVE